MGRKIVGIVILLAVLFGGFLLWRRHNDAQALANGDVHCDGCMTPAEQARFAKENAGETADRASERKTKTAREDAAGDVQEAAPTSEGKVSGAAGMPAQASSGQSSDMQPAALTLAKSGSQANPDTLPPNAQNGARFAGTGAYQWYRQGNITWRIDTATGRSCIIYATMEEWRKSIVLSHGCGRNA